MKSPLTLLSFLACSLLASAQSPELVWETSGFIGPESVVFDASRNEFFVSNMGTYGPGSTMGDGFISRVSAEGKLLELKWVIGLHDPKGLALANGKLYVGDDPGLAEIDLSTKKLNWHMLPDGPGIFNDCTVDPAGNVYVCSGRLDTVYRFQAGKLESWHKLDLARTGSPNGLKAEKDRLLLGAWSVKDAKGQEQLGHISTVWYENKSVGRLGTEPLCHIDGLEPDGQGGYTVTDWLTGDVLHVSPRGKPTPIMKLTQGTADHTYLLDKQLLIIPLMKDNVLRAYRWAPPAK